MKAVPSEELVASTVALGDWHANLVRVAGKQLVLFVNERTLLPVAVTAAPVGTLTERFRESPALVLGALGVSREQIARAVTGMVEVRIARSLTPVQGEFWARGRRQRVAQAHRVPYKLRGGARWLPRRRLASIATSPSA